MQQSFMSKTHYISCLCVFLWTILGEKVFAQDLLFNQYSQTPFLTNPAMFKDAKNIHSFFNYASRESFSTTMASFIYPFLRNDISENEPLKEARGNFGASFIYDNQSNHIHTTGFLLTPNYNLLLSKSKPQYLSFSIQWGIFQRTASWAEPITGNQLQGGIYNSLVLPDESFPTQWQWFPTVGVGSRYVFESVGRSLVERFYLGVFLNNLNHPDISLIENKSDYLPRSLTITAGIELELGGDFVLIPNGRYYRRLSDNRCDLGSWMGWDMPLADLKIGAWISNLQTYSFSAKIETHKYLFAVNYQMVAQNSRDFTVLDNSKEFTFGIKLNKKMRKPKVIFPISDTLYGVTSSRVVAYDTTLADFNRDVKDHTLVLKKPFSFVFDPYGEQLKPESSNALEKIAPKLKPDIRLYVIGFAAYPTMAEKLAKDIMIYLISKGYDKDKISSRGIATKKYKEPFVRIQRHKE